MRKVIPKYEDNINLLLSYTMVYVYRLWSVELSLSTTEAGPTHVRVLCGIVNLSRLDYYSDTYL